MQSSEYRIDRAAPMPPAAGENPQLRMGITRRAVEASSTLYPQTRLRGSRDENLRLRAVVPVVRILRAEGIAQCPAHRYALGLDRGDASASLILLAGQTGAQTCAVRLERTRRTSARSDGGPSHDQSASKRGMRALRSAAPAGRRARGRSRRGQASFAVLAGGNVYVTTTVTDSLAGPSPASFTPVTVIFTLAPAPSPSMVCCVPSVLITFTGSASAGSWR